MDSLSNKKRISWIDMAKGYGIILVILGHIGFGRFGVWIYSFHLPLFYFLSGYTYTTYSKFSIFTKKKTNTLLIPYFIIALSFLLFYPEVQTINFVPSIIIQKRYLLSWYLASLLVIEFIYYPIVKYMKNAASRVCITIVMVLIWLIIKKSVLPWNVDAALFASPFFIAGYEFKNNKLLDKFSKNKQICLCFLLLGINILSTYENVNISGSSLELFGAEYGCILLTYISAISGTLLLVLFSRLFSNRIIECIGRRSLFYYGVHLSISTPIALFILNYLGIFEQKGMLGILFKILLLLLIIIITTILAILFYKIKEIVKRKMI